MDTRDPSKSVCNSPVLFFLEDVERQGNNTLGTYMRAGRLKVKVILTMSRRRAEILRKSRKTEDLVIVMILLLVMICFAAALLLFF